MEKSQKINDELTLHIDGITSNGGDIDLSVFVMKLDNLRIALNESDKFLFGINKNSVDFFVTDLKRSSPSAITFGFKPVSIISDHQSNIFSYISNLIADITSGGYKPATANYKTLKSLTDLAGGIGDKFSSMWFSRNEKTVAVINTETLTTLNGLLSKQYHSFGAVKGKVKGYNSASKEKYFYVYPLIGSRVKCIFDDNFVSEASKIIEGNVTVNGLVSYLEGEFFPSEVKVSSIEEHANDDDLISLSSLIGIENNITNNATSVEFVKEVRDGWS